MTASVYVEAFDSSAPTSALYGNANYGSPANSLGLSGGAASRTVVPLSPVSSNTAT